MNKIFRNSIVSDPAFCGGAFTIKETQVLVKCVLDKLQQGLSIRQILSAYPELSINDIRDVIAFATASLAEDDLLSMPKEAIA